MRNRYGGHGGATWSLIGALALTAVIVIVLVGSLVIHLYASLATHDDVTITVNDKERTGGDNGKYLIYATVDGKREVLQNTDSWLNGKTDSSDVYALLEPGQSYSCTVYGYRVSLFSWYRNIIDCER